MSFGSNVMPKRFGAGREKPKTQVAQLKVWEAAAPKKDVKDRIREARAERKQYEATWLKNAKDVSEWSGSR